MAREADRRLVHFEVHVQRRGRWTIEHALADEAAACGHARQLFQRGEVEAVKVWKELHDARSGRSAGRLVLEDAKPAPKRRWRFARWTGEPASEPEPDGAQLPRRRVAARPTLPADWPLAAFSIGGGCVALVALAVLAALG